MRHLSKSSEQTYKINQSASYKVCSMRTQNHIANPSSAILIIDDDMPTLELYAGVLSNHFHVTVCSKPQDALTVPSLENLQLIVLEPSIAGLQCWDFLEKIIQTYGVPVIVCSVLEDRRSSMKAGANIHLIKPVLPVTLLEASQKLLAQTP